MNISLPSPFFFKYNLDLNPKETKNYMGHYIRFSSQQHLVLLFKELTHLDWIQSLESLFSC